jgi:hypothetical protein
LTLLGNAERIRRASLRAEFGIEYRHSENFKNANLRHAAWNSFRISRGMSVGLIPIYRSKADASGPPNEETKTFSASSIGCKAPSTSRSPGNGCAQRSCKEPDNGEGQFLAGPERGEKAHVQRPAETCGKVVLRIRYALTSKAMNWIVREVKTESLATLQIR